MATAAVAAAWISIAVAAGSAVQQVRVTNATNRVNQWQAKEEGRKAHLQSTQREVERLQHLRKTLAQNNVNAASSGVSLTSETVNELKSGSIKQFDTDQLTDRVNTNSFVNNLKATAAFNSQIAGMQNTASVVSGIGGVVSGALAVNTANTNAEAVKIKSEGG